MRTKKEVGGDVMESKPRGKKMENKVSRRNETLRNLVTAFLTEHSGEPFFAMAVAEGIGRGRSATERVLFLLTLENKVKCSIIPPSGYRIFFIEKVKGERS